MIDKNEQDPKPQKENPEPKAVQGRILRAKDIIPGKGYQDIPSTSLRAGRESGEEDFDIPQFNLANDIMSAQRRQSVVRRKGPESAEDRRPGFAQRAAPWQAEDRIQNIEHRTQNAEQRTQKAEWRLAEGIEILRDSIIAEIVARDIERLCTGH
jgi:hypothetical protein